MCVSHAGGCAHRQEEGSAADLCRGSGVCKWFNMRMGFGFLSMSSRDGAVLEEPLDVFVHQVRGCREVLNCTECARVEYDSLGWH